MKDLKDGRVQIDSYDFYGWCNCFNFPYSKCDECKKDFGNLTFLADGEKFILKNQK